jgi:hypothetical protein
MTTNFKIKVLFTDIRFWIVFLFLLRMYDITMPTFEFGHSWRQTDGMMIARNFYERDANILYPRVDVAGEKTGIVGSEFPILNYLVYLTSVVFGFEHWYGRLIVLIFSCLGVFFFHKTIKTYFTESVAFNASIVLLFSLWFSYSRKNIPDVFAVSLCIIALFYALKFLQEGTAKNLLLFFILGSFGCLSKILAATILTVLAIPLISKTISLNRKIILTIFSGGILLLVCLWYFIWVPYLNTTYGFEGHFFMGMSFHEGIFSIYENLPMVLKRFYSTPLKYIGFTTFLLAIFLTIRKKKWLPLFVFLIPFVAFLVLLVKTGASIIGDNYYILTAIPSMAFITGYGLTLINYPKVSAIILIAIGIDGIANQIYDFRVKELYRSLGSLESIMDQVSKRDDLVAMNGETHLPTAMYFAHRRGWMASNETLSDSVYVESIKMKGCKYIVVLRELNGDLTLPYPIVHESKYYKVYQLN